MSKLDIITVPNKLLHQISAPVSIFDKKLSRLSEDMLETMYLNDGIGLAAVQVGILKRIIVVDLQQEEQYKPLVLINPEIIRSSLTLCSIEEGCLSVPKERILIPRYDNIVVKYQNTKGIEKTIEAKDLLAICLQHEIDHLNGITILDKEQDNNR